MISLCRFPSLSFWSVLTICIISNLLVCSAHVSLTFPPARKYNLDYLDSSGSPPPCGMPKGLIKTSLVAGSSINITWHLAYPHQGGHRLELLSSSGKKLLNLTALVEDKDPTAQRHEVTLPKDFTCTDCIIRLLRQSAELRSPNYWFWSCGDVDIVPAEDYIETCTGNGKVRRSNGKCRCNKGYWGDVCQYEDDCNIDEDCSGGNGKCIDLGGTNLPRRQCFCYSGYLGDKCSKRSQVGNVSLPTAALMNKNYLAKNYKTMQLDDRFQLHWRVLEGKQTEIEFILVINGTSYGALGWRPFHFDGSCKRWPSYANDTTSTRGSKLKKRETSDYDVDSDDGGEGEEKYSDENSKYQRSRTTTQSELERDESPSTRITDEGEIEPKNQKQNQRRRYSSLHPMSCTDIVIGAARGNLYRILDYWTGDISTPKVDSFFDGSDDIKAAVGWENEYEGTTTLVFRKNVQKEDVLDVYNDWPLESTMHVIWARGQEHGEYVHVLPTGVDPDQKPSVPRFYTRDEIKYHGYESQRGHTVIDFLE